MKRSTPIKPCPLAASSDNTIWDLLGKLNIPCGSKWHALILFMRSIKDYEIYTTEQKLQVQDLVVQVLKDGKFTDDKFQELARKTEEVLSLPWRMRLQDALGEISRLIRDSRSMILHRKGDLEVLESNTVGNLQSGRDLEAVIDDIRLGFQDVIRLMEKDADTLARQSRTDQLTGLGNRRAFDEELDLAITKARDEGLQLTLLMVDVDHFKLFNDKHGHLIGDQALAAVASVLRDSQKQAEKLGGKVFCSRYGGEEFTVTLLGPDPAQALAMAEIVRKHIENYNFVIRDVSGGILSAGIKLTVSIGVAALRPQWNDALPQRLIHAADEALYAAKASGRNKVFMARLES